MHQQRRVALLIESSRSYGRGVLRGIAKYAHTHGHWELRHHEMMIDAEPPSWLRAWRGNGVIARIETERMARALRRLDTPTVDVRCRRKIRGIPHVETDDRLVVQLALDHLRDRGLTEIAYCGFQEANYSVRRLKFLRQFLAERSLEPRVYESPAPEGSKITEAELGGMLDEEGVRDWLATLPLPIGLIACNDIRAQHVLNASHAARLRIPDDVAIIGVDNDDVICPLCSPPLSSVESDTERVGYVAASILDRMMQGEEAPEEPTLIPPSGVVVRRSTEVWAVDDEVISSAYRYIRDNASKGINVHDVVGMSGLSRRTLERRMEQAFGKTPHELIASFRLQRLRQLLKDTVLPLDQVAALAGFRHVEHMHLFFKRRAGTTPGRYRGRFLRVG